MLSRSRKANVAKPLPSLVQTVPAPSVPVPSAASLLVAPQQPKNQPPDQQLIEHELQALRSGTHLGYLRALDSLDSGKCDQILAVHRLRDERLHNVSEMFAAEMQQVDDEYKDAADELRDKMIEELLAKTEKGPKSGDMMTRKRAKLSSKDERPKKKTNVKGIRYTLTSEEISSDLESVRSLMSGLGGSTRSKAKGH